MPTFRIGWIAALLLLAATLQATPRRTAILVVAHGITIEQLAQANSPKLQALVQTGALGLMTLRTAGSPTLADNAATLSAGAFALGTYFPPRQGQTLPQPISLSGDLFSLHERYQGQQVGDIYRADTGLSAPKGFLVQLHMAMLRQINTGTGRTVTPGLFGDTLQRAGVTVAAFGNADSIQGTSRCGAMIAMNSAGLVPIGDVSGLLRDVPERPSGKRTDYTAISERIQQMHGDRIFAVVDAGDGRRLEMATFELSAARKAQLGQQTTEELLDFLTRLQHSLQQSNGDYLICMAVLDPSAEADERQDWLAPVLLLGRDVKSGMLTSPSTRWPGIVMNLDLPPTILRFFNVATPDSMAGKPMQALPRANVLATLNTLDAREVAAYATRRPILIGFIVALIISIALYIVLAFCTALLGARWPGWLHVRQLGPLLVALLLVPHAFFLLGALRIVNTMPVAIITIVFTSAAAFALTRWFRPPVMLAIIGLSISVAQSIDLLLGDPVSRYSLLSYSPVAGFRFYGSGNENSGIYIAALLLGLFALLALWPQRQRLLLPGIALICLAATAILGLPTLGADFGGILAALAGFTLAIFRVWGRFNWKQGVLIGVIIGGVVLAALLLSDILLGPSRQSHVGQAFSAAHHHGVKVLWDIAVRKWTMNLRLMRFTIWAYALMSLVVGIAALFFRPVKMLRQAMAPYPALNAGFEGIVTSCIVGFLVNDSGLVMAATGMLYLALPLMLLTAIALAPPSAPIHTSASSVGSTT